MQKQPNSAMCFVCGVHNPIGLHLSFYDDEEGRVVARWTPGEEHQGYPGVLHGGIAATLLDEAAGRVLTKKNLWMATARLELRYRQPVPIGQPLTVIGEIVRLKSRSLEARGEIRLQDGSVAVEANGLYVQIPEERLASMQEDLRFWQVISDEPGEEPR
ncbi:MAG: PaaI family thioesterase [Chloroflexi bacterium]|nr:PaaI family thioesterase [Chloroflexota bacterium]